MFTLVVLQPEEIELTTRGKIDDPNHVSYNDYHNYGSTSTDIVNLNATPLFQFARLAGTKWWGSESYSATLILGVLNNEYTIIAIGAVASGTKPASLNGRGVRNVSIDIYYLLEHSIPLKYLTAEFSTRDKNKLDKILHGFIRTLPPALLEVTTEAIRKKYPPLLSSLDIVNSTVSKRLRQRLAKIGHPVLLEQASSSALRFFSPNWNKLNPESKTNLSDFAVNIESRLVTSVSAIESDVISDDSNRFLDWERSDTSLKGWWEFHDEERRLLIKNINASPEEIKTGADLVYIRRNPDAVILVQYKLLEKLQNGTLLFRPEDRLSKQISKMLKFESMQTGDIQSDDPDLYRLGTGFTFVKFIDPSIYKPNNSKELAPGYYIPSELARRIFLNSDQGPNGGEVFYIAEKRYIGSDVFARLVRECMVGSVGDVTSALNELFGIVEFDNDITLAVDEKMTIA
ncbi:hypothetical protein FACS1894104_4770 [Actinomycetota bacterium]|nr:hypothetical protein FACS1894104_4770 [Actinomycetota bacterium]